MAELACDATEGMSATARSYKEERPTQADTVVRLVAGTVLVDRDEHRSTESDCVFSLT